jgi:hypothetical protein
LANSNQEGFERHAIFTAARRGPLDERLEVQQEAGNTFEGPRKSVAVMAKDATLYQSTGGWGFEAFAGEDRTQSAPGSVRAACFSCHSRRKDHDFIFSEFRK